MIIDDKHVVGVDELMIHPYWRWWLRLSSRRLPVDRSSLDPTPRHEYSILDHPSESRYHGNHSQATIKTSPARNKGFQTQGPQGLTTIAPSWIVPRLFNKKSHCWCRLRISCQRQLRGVRVWNPSQHQVPPARWQAASSKAVKTCAGKTRVWNMVSTMSQKMYLIYLYILYPKEHKEKWEWETQRKVYRDFIIKTHLAKVSRAFVVSFRFCQKTSSYHKMLVAWFEERSPSRPEASKVGEQPMVVV